MYKNKQKGGAIVELLPIIGIFVLLFFVWAATGGPEREETTRNEQVNDGGGGQTEKPVVIEEYDPADHFVTIGDQTYTKSPWYGQVKIRRGNARSEEIPRDEYIILSTSFRNKESIPITGWFLENGDSQKVRNISGNLVRLKSDRASILAGVHVLRGVENEITAPIVLNPGDKAIVTTGSPYSYFPMPLNHSFRTNICTGYLNEMSRVDFTPKLKNNCPDPEDELSGVFIEDKCVDFIERLDNCHAPDTEPFRDRDNELVRRHLDGVTGLSNQCRDFVTKRFSYQGCFNSHVGDENFLNNEWRIYLNQNFQLWADDDEIITLYDHFGRLVDQYTY